MKKNNVQLSNAGKYSQVPDDLLTAFYKVMHEKTMTVEKNYEVDPVSGGKILAKVKTVEREYAIKDVISIFQLLFPQYFDELQYQRAKKIKQLDTSSTDKELAQKIKDALS